jgi:hypothetical protein
MKLPELVIILIIRFLILNTDLTRYEVPQKILPYVRSDLT